MRYNQAEIKVVIGFDFGMKRIGVAIGNAFLRSAKPLSRIIAKDGVPNWEEISQLIKEWDPQCFVVGIPLHIDGSEQQITFAAKSFSKKLRTIFKLPVHNVDERLTTKEARQQLFDDGGFNKLKKADIDSFAAKLIVEQWLYEN